MAQEFTLSDGRKVDYLISAAEKGFPLVSIHGTPGSYTVDSDTRSACQKKNIKLITVSRAGYGGSSRNHGRRVVDFVADIHELLGHLGHKECVVAGRSGGGPHALAAAARLPGCLAALCICGLAPYPADGLDFFAGLGEDNVDEFKAALAGEEAVTKFCNAQRPGMLSADPASIVEQLSSLLPEVDRKAILENPNVGQELVGSMAEALRSGVDGWVDDDLAFAKPWGFELSEIRVPVLLYQGDQDMMVPLAHGKWLSEHLPQDKVRSHLMNGEGHFSIAHRHFDAMLAEILVAARR